MGGVGGVGGMVFSFFIVLIHSEFEVSSIRLKGSKVQEFKGSIKEKAFKV
jgi:hypothetical protein